MSFPKFQPMKFFSYLFEGKAAEANPLYEAIYASVFGVAIGGVWKQYHWDLIAKREEKKAMLFAQQEEDEAAEELKEANKQEMRVAQFQSFLGKYETLGDFLEAVEAGDEEEIDEEVYDPEEEEAAIAYSLPLIKQATEALIEKGQINQYAAIDAAASVLKSQDNIEWLAKEFLTPRTSEQRAEIIQAAVALARAERAVL